MIAAIATSNKCISIKKLLGAKRISTGSKKLLVAPGIATRNKDTTSNKCISTSSKCITTSNKKLLVAKGTTSK